MFSQLSWSACCNCGAHHSTASCVPQWRYSRSTATCIYSYIILIRTNGSLQIEGCTIKLRMESLHTASHHDVDQCWHQDCSTAVIVPVGECLLQILPPIRTALLSACVVSSLLVQCAALLLIPAQQAPIGLKCLPHFCQSFSPAPRRPKMRVLVIFWTVQSAYTIVAYCASSWLRPAFPSILDSTVHCCATPGCWLLVLEYMQKPAGCSWGCSPTVTK